MNFTLNDKLYNVLKWIVIIGLPSVSVLLVTLTKAWCWDIPIEPIVVTISAIEVFIGTLIGISTASYNKEVDK
jgi:hypothetical protein